ncbi:hypothetical protein BWQ96_09296 [Gracilariopsis chorda]|uniref:CCHC-type domain-containing protein n=1 Tax=Gracilariopsis chorda TaxID=448386 RepID=A0A2V3IG12_9FLOR|nr:hypothetical protein BWQ96_09296 [Gracilariopsis chorda]|eukprot:PXF41001.1 hypothetical protein BWQ96_09296 [Gracilariopsis chorda]
MVPGGTRTHNTASGPITFDDRTDAREPPAIMAGFLGDFALSCRTPLGTERSDRRRILRRPEQTVKSLESKVDDLTDKLARFTLLVQKKQSDQSVDGNVRLCSFCQKLGHGAIRCPANPHRDSRCGRCHKLGHSEATCWSRSRIEKEKHVRLAEANVASKTEEPLRKRIPLQDAEATAAQVTALTEEQEVDPVVTTKRGPDGQALPKKPRSSRVDIGSLLNPNDQLPSANSKRIIDPTGPPVYTKRRKATLQKKGAKRKTVTRAKQSIPEHVGR